MKSKAKKFHDYWKRNPLTRVISKQSNVFLQSVLKAQRERQSSGELRAALGLMQWLRAEQTQRNTRVAIQSACILTGRNRGASQRFGVSRLKLKELARTGMLFGLMKQHGWK